METLSREAVAPGQRLQHSLENHLNITLEAFSSQFLVGLSHAMVLFIVSSGLSFVLGVLRVPNIAHGSLYMIGAFVTYSISTFFSKSPAGFWLALLIAPLIVALVGLIL